MHLQYTDMYVCVRGWGAIVCALHAQFRSCTFNTEDTGLCLQSLLCYLLIYIHPAD